MTFDPTKIGHLRLIAGALQKKTKPLSDDACQRLGDLILEVIAELDSRQQTIERAKAMLGVQDNTIAYLEEAIKKGGKSPPLRLYKFKPDILASHGEGLLCVMATSLHEAREKGVAHLQEGRLDPLNEVIDLGPAEQCDDGCAHLYGSE